MPRARSLRVPALLRATLTVPLTVAALGCPGDPAPPPNVLPDLPTTLSAGPATIYIPAGRHFAAEGQGVTGLRVDLEIGRSDASLPLELGETLLGDIVTVRHDQVGPISLSTTDADQPFARLTLRFDPSRLPEAASYEPHEILVVARFDAEDEDASNPIAGQVATARALGVLTWPTAGDAEAGASATIDVEVSTLPPRMDLAVVHAADLAVLSASSTPPMPFSAPTWRTALPPWPCCAVYVVYPYAPPDRDCTRPEFERNSACRFRRIAERTEGSGDSAAIDRVVQNRVVQPALGALRAYLDLGLRRPKIVFRPLVADGPLHAVIHAGWGPSRYTLGGPFPEVHIEMAVIESDGDSPRGTTVGHLFHELAHAIIEGYDIATLWDDGDNSLRGVHEGLAMVLENTLGTASPIAQVRSSHDHAIYRLGMPLLSYELPYANDDFFGYLWRRHLDNDFGFLAGDEGLLELLALHSGAVDATTAEGLRIAYLRALDDAIRTRVPGLGLHEVFDAFIRDRFYEHGPASRLRAADTQPADQPVIELFVPGEQRLTVPVIAGLDVSIPGPAAPLGTLADGLAPMQAALVTFEAAGGFAGKLELDLEPGAVPLGDEGLRVTLYHEGSPGLRLTDLRHVDQGFGSQHPRLHLLMVNASLGKRATLGVRARTEEKDGPPDPPVVACPETVPLRGCVDGRCLVYGGAPCTEHGPAVEWPLIPHDALHRNGEVIQGTGHWRLRCAYAVPGDTCTAGFMAYWTTPGDPAGSPSYPQWACDEPGQLATASMTRLNSETHQAAVGVPSGIAVEGSDALFRLDVLAHAERILKRIEATAALCE